MTSLSGKFVAWRNSAVCLFILSLAAAASPLAAQTAALLPDAPHPGATGGQSAKPTEKPFAPHYARYIDADQKAVPLHGADKLTLSLWEQAQIWAFATETISGGWSHLIDSDPKYGSNSEAFGQRVGAAAARQTSQAIFSDGVMATLLHQDPRYYRKGKASGSVINRVVYAATRVVITRGDAGGAQVNYSDLVGYAGAAVLTRAYYPPESRSWGKVASGWGYSLGGAALGNGLHEFLPDLEQLLHIRQKEFAGR